MTARPSAKPLHPQSLALKPMGRAALAAGALAAWLAAAEAHAASFAAAKARKAIIALDTDEAAATLGALPPTDASVVFERALLALYLGDCDRAFELLGGANEPAPADEDAAEVRAIAEGCRRTMAGAVTVADAATGVSVRLQDDADRPLVPLVVRVVEAMRAVFVAELGVTMPRDIRVEVVRDQLGLSAMTGLPEEAARTTGTVAIAKWGRVFVISPRASPDGYAWLDTLAHELTHLALTRGSDDKAPLWLQEGVAKREETRWRPSEPTDEVPSHDDVAAVGLAKGLGRPIDKLGPSLALLPTPEDARVAYSEVASFLRFFVEKGPPEGLPKLLAQMKQANGAGSLEQSLVDVSGADLSAWDKRWRGFLTASPRSLPPELGIGVTPPGLRDASRASRLGSLLAARQHLAPATRYLSDAQRAMPKEGAFRAELASALSAQGRRDEAAALVRTLGDLHSVSGRWFSLHAELAATPAEREHARLRALSLEPYSPAVACEERASPELPADPVARAVCQAARAFRRVP